jgi:hypothetical protein
MLESAERVDLARIFKGNFEGTEIRAKADALENQSVASAFESLSPFHAGSGSSTKGFRLWCI